MEDEKLAAFFYGLFMDGSLLASKGINTSGTTTGYVEGYRLRIRRRATLVRDELNRRLRETR